MGKFEIGTPVIRHNNYQNNTITQNQGFVLNKTIEDPPQNWINNKHPSPKNSTHYSPVSSGIIQNSFVQHGVN